MAATFAWCVHDLSSFLKTADCLSHGSNSCGRPGLCVLSYSSLSNTVLCVLHWYLLPYSLIQIIYIYICISNCFFFFHFKFCFVCRLQLQSPGHYSPLEAFYEDKRALLPSCGEQVITVCPANTWGATINRSMHPEMKVSRMFSPPQRTAQT